MQRQSESRSSDIKLLLEKFQSILQEKDQEARFRQIQVPIQIIRSSGSTESNSKYQQIQRQNTINLFASDLARKVMTRAFKLFQENVFNDAKMEHYFCNNFLSNIIKFAQKNKLTVDQIRNMDNHLKKQVFPFLKQRYPQSQLKQTSRKLSSMVVPVDNSESNLNDLIFQSKVKFEYKKDSKDYTEQIMRFINYILSVTKQKVTENKQKETETKHSLTDLFYIQMEQIFKKVEDYQWMSKMKGQQQKIQIPNQNFGQEEIDLINKSSKQTNKLSKKTNEQETIKDSKMQEICQQLMGPIFDSNTTIYGEKILQNKNLGNKSQKLFIKQQLSNSISSSKKFAQVQNYGLRTSKIDKKDQENNKSQEALKKKQLQKQKYRNSVKQYTKYLIGQKLSDNITPFTKKQIQDQKLTINDNGLMRVLVKWCQQLQKCYQEVNIYTKEQRFRMADGSQRYTKKSYRKQLYDAIKEEHKHCSQTINEIKQNLYENQEKIFSQGKYSTAFRHFSSQNEGTVGYFATAIRMSNQNYLISYINKLIHGILKAQQHVKSKHSKKQFYKIAVNLISFKIGDLLRCKCSSKQPEIIALYRYLLELCKSKPKIFDLVRVKNRLSQGTKDILINLRYREKLLIQMQLSVDENTTRFIKCSDKANHFLYELQRATFGPISQICNVYMKTDPRAEYFKKKFLQINNFQNQNNETKNCGHNNLKQQTYPCWCTKCKGFVASLNIPSNHKRCSEKQCRTKICSICQIKNKFKNKLNKAQIQYGTLINSSQKQKLIRKKLQVIDLQRKKKVQRDIYIAYYNARLMIFQKIQQHNEHKNKMNNTNNNKSQIGGQKNRKRLVKYLGEAQNEKQYKNLFSKSIVTNFQDIDDKNQQKIIQQSIYDEIIRVFIKNTKQKMKKNFVIQETKVNIDVFQDNSSCRMESVQQINMNNDGMQSIDKLVNVFPNARFVLLHKNKITNIQGISKWKENIEELILQGNRLESLPSQIEQLQKLKTLLLSNNRFVKFPEEVCRLKLLQKLHLKENRIQIVSPNVGQLTNLKILALTNNQIRILPSQIGSLTELQQLDLSQNYLQKLPTQLTSLKKLKLLNIEINKITKIDDDLFNKMQSIQKIFMSNNKIENISNSIKGKKYLTILDLEYNCIRDVPGFVFRLENLGVLKINNNLIEEIGNPQENPQKNQGSLQEKLGNLKIRELHLTNNKFKKIPQFIFKIKTIQKLKIGGKSLQKGQLQYIKNLTNLKNLSLQYMQLTQFPPILFELNTGLESLSLDHNCISYLPTQIGNLRNLIQLYLSDNCIKEIPQDISKFEKLENLGLSHNREIETSGILSKLCLLKRLEKVKLFGIQGLKEEEFYNLVKGDHFRQLFYCGLSQQDKQRLKSAKANIKIIQKQNDAEIGPKLKISRDHQKNLKQQSSKPNV